MNNNLLAQLQAEGLEHAQWSGNMFAQSNVGALGFYGGLQNSAESIAFNEAGELARLRGPMTDEVVEALRERNARRLKAEQQRLGDRWVCAGTRS